MLWFKLGWRNLWRNKGRTFVQLAVISGSLVFSIFFNNLSTGSYDKMIEDAVKSGSGHLVFQHPKYLKERRINQVFNASEAFEIIKNQNHIKYALPRLIIPSLARSSHDSRSAVILGVDFQVEKKINSLLAADKRIKGELPAGKHINRAYIGAKLANNLQLKIGRKIVVMFQNIKGKIESKLFRVAGIFKSGVAQIDGNTIFVDRKTLAKAFGSINMVHELALILDNRQYLPELKTQMEATIKQNQNFVLLSWKESMKQVADAITIDHTQFKIMVFFLYFLVGIGTVNLLLMSVLERTREFGLLRALGMKKINVVKMIINEASVLALLGIALGLFFSLFASGYSWVYGIDFSALVGGPQEVAGMLFDPVVHSKWNIPWMIGLSIGLFCIVIIGSIYPARKALRITPSSAMGKY